jgi:acetoin utilization deacetylase AcuC-like enzyme
LHFDTLTQNIHAMNATGYFTHPDCRKHDMGRGHPECPERLDAIDDWLLATGVKDALDCREAAAAPIADLELAHDSMMVSSLRELSVQLRDEIDDRSHMERGYRCGWGGAGCH